MKVLLFLTTLTTLVVTTLTQNQGTDNELDKNWETFKKYHGKTYTSSLDELKRKQHFRNNFNTVTDHNAKFENGEVTFTMSVNTFADMSFEEFEASYLGLGLLKGSDSESSSEELPAFFNASTIFHLPEDTKIPESLDWRLRGVVTPMKDQFRCGSCWTFSCTGSLEGQYSLQSGELVSLSEQQLLECVDKNSGCEGGFMNYAFEYLKENHTIHTEQSYPYFNVQFKCRNKPSCITATLADYVDIPSGDEKQLQLALATVGPISVAIMSTHEFRLYSGGVFSIENCENRLGYLNHAVTLVGYGTHWTGQEVWLLKNQWGSGWGMRGYMLLARNKGNMCGIATMSTYPVLST